VRLELHPGAGAPVEPVVFDGQNLTLEAGGGFQPGKPLKVTSRVLMWSKIILSYLISLEAS
jgi:hypothetical protein